MHRHRTYVEKSKDFEKMIQFVSRLNSLHIYDWSVGRMYGWKYGRWNKRSQDDSQFEKQAELFFDNFDNIIGIVVTENFGYDYYLLSEKKENLIQHMIYFLTERADLCAKFSVIVSTDDTIQKDVLIKNEFYITVDADVTYTYSRDQISLPNIKLPDSITLSDQEKYNDIMAVEKQRFFSFNPDSEYDEVIHNAYMYSRNNPLLVPALNIVLLDSNLNPVSSCMGYWDKDNYLMEIEVVATKAGYENRGFAKIVISECMRRGLNLGVIKILISAWEDKTRRLYSSFGKAIATKKVKYGRS